MQNNNIFEIPDETTQTRDLLQLIDEDWLMRKENWLLLGQILYNVLGVNGLSFFERYTPEKFKGEYEQVFGSYQKTVHGLRGLKTIILKTNPQEFKKWQTRVIKAAALGALGEIAAMTEIADIVHFMFGHQFVCCDVTNQRWMIFDGVWQLLSGGHSMKQKFSRELEPVFKRIYKNMQTLEEDDKLKEMKKKCAFIIRGLKEPGFKSTLLKEASEIFFVQDFEKDCDSVNHIINMKNGVYDLNKDQLRMCLPEDMCSLQMNASLDESKTWESEGVVYMMDFYKKIFVDEGKRNYCMKHKSTYMYGGNPDKHLVMHLGPTAHNGKTTANNFDLDVFGTYADKLPTSVLMGKDVQSGGANPALAGTKGTRLQQIDEVTKKQSFNPTFLKIATGNDKIWARPLYSNGYSFTPQFTIILIGNEAPDPKKCAGDAGAEERWIWLEYDSRFVKNAPESEKEQWEKRIFPADTHIKEKLLAYRDDWLWILVQKWKEYKREGLNPPADIVKKTSEYIYKSNPFLQFKDKNMVQAKNTRVTIAELYSAYRAWYMECFSDKADERPNFVTEMNKLIGEPKKGTETYEGWKLKLLEVKEFDN